MDMKIDMKSPLIIALGIFGLVTLVLVFDIRQHTVSIDKKLDTMTDNVSTLNKRANKSLLLKM